MKKADVQEFFTRLRAGDPAPKSELNWTNPYTLVVAVSLSAQATDVGVNKATEKLFKIADTPQKMLALGLDGLKDHIKTIGLYNNKAKNVIAMSRMLIDDFGGAVPRDRAQLEKLPGVGRKTANVVLNVCWGSPPWRWTRTSSGCPTAPAWRRAKRRWRWSKNCSKSCPRNSWSTPITG